MLSSEFFDRNAVVVAKELLGKYLCREGQKYKIIETEAYEGLKDLASHASRGQTARNKLMFGKPGVIYVYFTYGMHWMLNIVCGPAGHPAAVLIRGVEGCVGPGRLTKKLKIDKNLNGKILSKRTGLWIESPSPKASADRGKIQRSARIGVSYAGPIWSKKKWRFFIKKED